MCTESSAVVVQELPFENESDFPRKQIASLDDEYDVEKILGTGGFGIVQKATPRTGGPAIAVKTIAKTSHVTREIASTEIQILQGLTHANICKLLNVCEDTEHTHLVLEFVRGHELFEEVSPDRPMKESRVVSIMRQVFQALQYCHGLEPAVIHRDLKPENIMVTDGEDGESPEVKIIDWGLAAPCQDTIETALVGTACYMAPEAMSVGIYSRASDMWSAGAVLHMVLSGGETPPQFKPLGSQTRSFNDHGMSKAAQSILHGLLQRLPEKRLTATSAVGHPWTKAVSSDSVHGKNEVLSCQSENACQASPSAVVDKCAAGAGVLRGSLDEHPWAGVNLSQDPSTDFIIFNDFEQAGESGNSVVKEPKRQRNAASRRNTKCKENCGPPSACKPMSGPTSSQKCIGALTDCAREEALRVRPMR